MSFIGHCDVLGLIYAYLQLRLSLTYEQKDDKSTEFRGVGRVKLKIRICKFVKIKVDRKFEKTIAKSGAKTISKSGAQSKKKLAYLRGPTVKPEERTSQFVSHFFDLN